MQSLGVRNGDERITPAYSDLAGNRDVVEPFGEARERLRVVPNECHGFKEARPRIGSEIILQSVVRQRVGFHVLNRPTNELLSGQVFEWLKRGRVNDFV